MKLVYQTVYTDHEKGVIGNCFAACIASLLECELESLPVGSTTDAYRETFRQHGFNKAVDVRGEPPHDDNIYLTVYKVDPIHDPRGIAHIVLTRNGEIVHDPSQRELKLLNILGYISLTSE
mgnify:CR=1 FL=1